MPLQGRGVYATPAGEILVKTGEKTDEWQPVESFTRDLNRDDLSSSYGLWKDKRIEKGAWFWKDTVRDYDNTPQSDEAKTCWGLQTKQSYQWHGNTRYGYLLVDPQITGTASRRPTLHYNWEKVSYRHVDVGGLGGL